ncbi:Zinc ribbon domain protein [uncultured archaeon]|nr:Zinc ribbon domain protein [uncultured archaeon]
MCLVDSSTSIDIDTGELGTEYRCKDCDTRFKGLGKKITCPSCQSSNVKRV